MTHDANAKNACGLCCTKIEGLTVTYSSRPVLENVNLHIHCGEITAIVGPNGAGKSTFLKALLGLIPHEGSISFVDASGVDAHPRIGYVPQFLETDRGAPLSVLDLFALASSSRPVFLGTGRAVRERTERLLAKVNAEKLIDYRVGHLSGGELQRVMLALALEKEPDILLLDEPVSGVDPAGLELFYSTLDNIRRSFDLTIIIVSHDLDLVARFSDRLVLLDSTIRAVGPTKEVVASEQYAQFLGGVL